jgi:hypothetical protein
MRSVGARQAHYGMVVFTKLPVCYRSGSRGSSVCSVWLRAGRPGERGSIPDRGERIFPVASVSRPAQGPTQPPVQWVPGVLSPELKRGRSVTLTTHLHLVQRSRMRNYISSPPTAFMACSGTAFL